MAFVMVREVPTSSAMVVPHGPAGVGAARRRMREDLRVSGAPDALVDDAVLVLSELLSNAYRHARPLGLSTTEKYVRAAWSRAGAGDLTISVTDGGGPTLPCPSRPSVTAHGGRGLAIISSLSRAWGVEENAAARAVPHAGGGAIRDEATVDGGHQSGVTVWAVLDAADRARGPVPLPECDLTGLEKPA